MKPSFYPEAPALTEGQLWDAIQSLRDGIIVYDRHERVVFYNRRLIELYPVLERWIAGESTLEFHCPKCDLLVAPGLRACPNDRTPNVEFAGRKRL